MTRGSSFETSESHAHERLKPLHVALRVDVAFDEVRAMVADLAGWTVESVDESRHVVVCAKRGGILGGDARITITCSGPEGLPSSVVNVRSESSGGLLARDRANVLEFTTPFHRRVC